MQEPREPGAEDLASFQYVESELDYLSSMEPDDGSELPYDGDLNDPRQYCKHGTFIGSWWGPDYLCPRCEMGDEEEE